MALEEPEKQREGVSEAEKKAGEQKVIVAKDGWPHFKGSGEG